MAAPTPYILTSLGDIAVNNMPSTWATNFGSGGATFLEEGNIYKFTSTTGVAPGGTGITNDYVLASFSLPANSFDVANRMLTLEAYGSFAAAAEARRAKIWWGATTATVGSLITGGTLIADTGSYSTAGPSGWSLGAQVVNATTGGNSQVAIHFAAQMGATVASLIAPQALTITASSPILIAVTGACTATSDMALWGFYINAMN